MTKKIDDRDLRDVTGGTDSPDIKVTPPSGGQTPSRPFSVDNPTASQSGGGGASGSGGTSGGGSSDADQNISE